MSVTERAVMMAMMVCVAMMPIPVMCPTSVSVPPTRPITPIPRTIPCVPCIRPEPIVYYRSVNIYRLDDVIGAVNVLITYYLNGNIVRFIFLNVY